MLTEAGVEHTAISPGVDDGGLAFGGVEPGAWVASLAYLKASAGAAMALPQQWIMGADTVCVDQGRVIGQPADVSEARQTLTGFIGSEHQVVSGVALLHAGTGQRVLLIDTAVVRWGAVEADQIETYLASGAWQGKAGAYNLTERLEAGWPIEVEGDPDAVVGLPMRKLMPVLEPLLAAGNGPAGVA